ncbi:Phytochrome A-associated F-box [Musa troglodytarum]|uniref:Phytochrome A-associated F-box n=1 Tax=Musa troglodytarum TaxID=320322 RepID=A0A9E7EPU5_9LILI|nr:Phytochrome A-associated F-box [Musa troglodytarum]
MREGRPAWLLILGAVLLLILSSLEEGSGLLTEPSFSRADFPLDFVFGAGTSSYQVEGAVSEDGRKPSIWDTFTHAGRMLDKSTGDVASDGYHKYKEDVKLMAETGLDSYRFSISWSRLIPNGRGAVNPKGLQFYNNLIDELVKYGIQPHVSLYHLDHPQALEDDYSGWLSPKMVDDFTAFADVCFKNFGDRVPRWTTIVQPNIMSMGAYDMGTLPPNRCSYPFGIINCTVGNSTTEPYIVVHNVLLAHASIVKLYKSKYQAKQNGWIGINVYTFQYYPLTNSSADIEATQRILEFYVGWILNPLVFGDYPEVMKKIVGSRLPSFTKSQSEQIKGLFDFIGVNHYASVYVKDNINASEMGLRDFIMDSLALMASYGIGRRESSLNDTDRINYLNGFIGSTLDAIRREEIGGYLIDSGSNLQFH